VSSLKTYSETAPPAAPEEQKPDSISRPQIKKDLNGWMRSLLAFGRRRFARTKATTVAEPVLIPLGVGACTGLMMGLLFAARHHFLDPAAIAYSICIDVGIQTIILLPALALAFITRRKAWTGALVAIGFFCFLMIPNLMKLATPGVVHWLARCIGVLGGLQIARIVNRRVPIWWAPWMIGVPALVAVVTLSIVPIGEYFQMSALPPPPASPNVLVIVVDTLRADHLSPYGYMRDTSPFLTQLAKQGVLFENAISPSSWTLPSHASMLTGRYPEEIGVRTDADVLSGGWPNLGDAMAKRGYRTGAFSANFLFFSRDHGFFHGFSHFEGYEQSLVTILKRTPASRLILTDLSHNLPDSLGRKLNVRNAVSAETINQNALRWIDRGNRPFFVVLNYIDAHEPNLPPEPYLHTFTKDPLAWDTSWYFGNDCAWAEVGSRCDAERQQFLDIYDGSVRYVDDSVRHLLSQLSERHLLENTIVLVTSDHGQEFGEHGIYGHGKSLYRREIQVPLIVWKPGLVPSAVRISTPVSTTEIPATILDLVAGDLPAGANKPTLPGQTLAGLWRSGQLASTWPEPISELARLHWRTKNAPNYDAPIRSIVTPEWHYVRQQDSDMLFDWNDDPEETDNRCTAQPAVCSRLKTQAQAAESSTAEAH
jgi:arylsulfatase A-like enzyme